MIRRPPRSTLFPTRRSSDLSGADPERVGPAGTSRAYAAYALGLLTLINLLNYTDRNVVFALFEPIKRERSEEHTSELQSLAYLVCRLLLEKKKVHPREQTPC